MCVWESVSLVMRLRATGGTVAPAARRSEGIVAHEGQMKDGGECCRIRAGSLSLRERGPRCRGRAENSTAEGERETEHINNRAKISL